MLGFILNNGFYTFFDVPGQQGNCCFNMGINDAGVIVGAVDDAGVAQDFIRSADGSQYVFINPTVVGNPILDGVNNLGQLIGFGYDSTLTIQSFVCSAGGNSCMELPPIPYSPGSEVIAHGINDSGEIVGTFASQNSFCTGPCAGSLLPTPEIDTLSMTITALAGILLLRHSKRRATSRGWNGNKLSARSAHLSVIDSGNEPRTSDFSPSRDLSPPNTK
jgi:uncharacterized membrane protein